MADVNESPSVTRSAAPSRRASPTLDRTGPSRALARTGTSQAADRAATGRAGVGPATVRDRVEVEALGECANHLMHGLGDNFAVSPSAKIKSTLDRLPGLPPESEQMLVVTSDGWNDVNANLQRFEKQNREWTAVGEPIPVTVGRNGMGWGRGVTEASGDVTPVGKREGDGRAPAGIFPIGTAFGYDAQAPAGSTMPYRALGSRDYFVDDVKSPDYNTWQTADDPKSRWQSFETMKRDDALYERGLVVEHNTRDTEPGAGSAIFMHVWRAPGKGTHGCTAMAKENMEAIMSWLQPGKKPLLLQAPADSLDEVERLSYAADR